MNTTSDLFTKRSRHPAAGAATIAALASALINPASIHAATLQHALVKSATNQFVSPHGYSVTQPSGWMKNTSGIGGSDIAYYLTPVNGFATNIIVVVIPEPAGAATEQLAGSWVAQNKAVSNSYNELSQGMAQVDGLPALHTVQLANPKSANHLLKVEEYALVRNRSLYEFVYTALPTQYAPHEAAFQKLIAGARWR